MDNLTGGAAARAQQLAGMGETNGEHADWLRAQLELALEAWGESESELSVLRESREDY